MHLDKEIRPDFVIDYYKGNTIIKEHFGMNDAKYNANRESKERDYINLCRENKNFFFVSTDEDDMYILKERLGKKMNETP